MRCPTCRRRDAGIESACPRCGTDLAGLRSLLRRQGRLTRQGFAALREGRPSTARPFFEQAARLRLDRDAAEGMALCCLAEKDFAGALSWREKSRHAPAPEGDLPTR